MASKSHAWWFPVLLGLAIASPSVAAELLTPPDSAPLYSLSNIRIEESNFGKAQIVFDYQRTRAGKGMAQIAARTENGEMQIMGGAFLHDESGTFRLERMFSMGRSGEINIEVYVVTNAYWGGKSYGSCLISNTLQLGNPGSGTMAREWTDEERAAWDQQLLADAPPTSYPAGFQPITATTKLLPGMPVQAGRYGKWQAAEVVQAQGSAVQVLYDSDQVVAAIERNMWLAVDPKVIQEGLSNPGKFKSQVTLLPGGRVPVPLDAVPLSPKVRLLVGTPLLFERGNEFETAYVVAADNKTVKVHFERLSSAFDREEPYSSFAIARATLDRMKQPGAAEEFAANVERTSDGSRTDFPGGEGVLAGYAKAPPKRFTDHYQIRGPIPKDCQVVPDDLSLQPGTPLAGYWGFEWKPITLLSENDDGTLNVSWNGYGDAWDCSMPRAHLIIQNKTIKKLERTKPEATSEAPTSADLAKTLRTWTDKSGQHKIEARFVRKTATEVVLVTDAGREIKLPIAKLSDADQALVTNAQTAADNPFE